MINDSLIARRGDVSYSKGFMIKKVMKLGFFKKSLPFYGEAIPIRGNRYDLR